MISLRQTTADDWALIKTIRLEALQTCPGYFGANFEKSSQYDEATWRSWGQGTGKAIFLLFDDNEVVGITGIITSTDDPATAICVASYLKPSYRGQKLSRLFYEARIDWARKHGYRRIETGHRLSNTASMQANQAFGFKETHRAPHHWPDGTDELEVFYDLIL